MDELSCLHWNGSSLDLTLANYFQAGICYWKDMLKHLQTWDEDVGNYLLLATCRTPSYLEDAINPTWLPNLA
jgi:hypothetical protein